MQKEQIQIAAQKIKNSNFTVVSSGAGISAESGVPTFRGEGGFWRNYSAQQLATPQAFAKNPKLVWEFYDYRKSLISKVAPNAGHYAVAELEKTQKCFALITQNVDNLHYFAGSRKITELHGNIFISCCTKCSYETREIATPLVENPPPCPQCGAILRPKVVWFGESLPQEALEKGFQFSKKCNLMILVGSSGVVQPAASLPFLAKDNGAFIIEINIENTPISNIADMTILGKSGEILSEIIKLI